MKRLRNDTYFAVLPNARVLQEYGKRIVQVELFVSDGAVLILAEVMYEKV
jgi:hypothetical protein